MTSRVRWFGVAAAAIVVAALGRQAVDAVRRRYVVAIVRGDSMLPTFRDGERVKVRRISGLACQPGDVIVFAVDQLDRPGDPPSRLKRVAAVAGDPVPPWMSNATITSGAVIPAGFLAVHGDNPRSESSKHLGYVSCEAVIGVVTTARASGPVETVPR
jgi:signal peptidase I